jgi:hypothetical protein
MIDYIYAGIIVVFVAALLIVGFVMDSDDGS